MSSSRLLEWRDLLPCPFCGSRQLVRHVGTGKREEVFAGIKCFSCGSGGPTHRERDCLQSDIKLWNCRILNIRR